MQLRLKIIIYFKKNNNFKMNVYQPNPSVTNFKPLPDDSLIDSNQVYICLNNILFYYINNMCSYIILFVETVKKSVLFEQPGKSSFICCTDV